MAAVPSIGRAREVEPPSFALEARLTERLYERHYRRVFGFCLYQLRDRDDAADAVQTTFLYALKALRRGVVPSFEAPWLMAIARNVCRSWWDAGRRRREVEFAHDPHRLAEVAPGRESNDRLLGLDEALAVLPEPQRRAVLLRDWQGLSYQEVATELDVSVSAAETLIFRGRQALARALNGEAIGNEPRKRSFGLGSLLGALKTGLFGGSIAAKVAAGAAVVGLGVAAGTSIADQHPVRHSVSPISSPSELPQRIHLVRAARMAGKSARVSSNDVGTALAAHGAALHLATTGKSSAGVPSPSPTPASAPGAVAGDPTTTPPASEPPPADGKPSGSPVAVPPHPVTVTTAELVANVPTITAPVIDTAEAVITTVAPVVTSVVGAVQPVIDLTSPIVNAVTTPITPSVTLPGQIVPIHVP